MRYLVVFLTIISFLFIVCEGTAISAEYIMNGGFETGDFTGWVIDYLNISVDTWVINDGTFNPNGPGEPLSPISGDYDAVSEISAYGGYGLPLSFLIQQTITLPSNISSATLSWSDRIRNYSEEWGEQNFLVYFGEENLIFSLSDPDDLIQIGPNSRAFDITELAQSIEGQEIDIYFVVGGLTYYIDITIDNVSLEIETAITVDIDIKPDSEQNCFNNNGHGVIPVAILGSADLNVAAIDAGSVMLEGLAVKAVGKSNKLLANYDDVNYDGFEDLIVQIEDTDKVFEEGDTSATITGNLNNGMRITGSDLICIVP